MKRTWPPDFTPRLNKRGFGNKPIHELFVSEEFLKTRLLRLFVHTYATDTPVMDVLNKAVAEMINRVKQVNCSWRWKIMKLLPTDMVDSKRFVEKCELDREHISQLVEVIYNDIFPLEHFGSTNATTLIKLIVDYLWGYKITEQPSLKPLDISYLRAMRCKEFKEKLKKAGLSSSIESIYNMACRAFLELAHEVVVSISLMFVERAKERHRQRVDGFPSYYSAQCFNFWKKKELKLFKADYALVPENENTCEKPITSKTVVVPSRSSLRPICPFNRKMYEYSVLNEARELNAALDFHLRKNSCGYPPSKGLRYTFKDIRCFLKSVPKEKELFFIKADVTKAFANIKLELLNYCLKELVSDRKCVTVTRKVTNETTGAKFDMVAADDTFALASVYLTKYVRRKQKKFVDPIANWKISEWSAKRVVRRIWDMFGRLRFRIGLKHKGLYRMKKGVPQGFFISSRLSHIYLSKFDQQLTQFNVKRYRYVDDYLFIAQTKEDAINLLDYLQRPSNDYGIEFRRGKTETSFSCDYVQNPSSEMIWCGGKLDTRHKKFTPRPANSLVMCRNKVKELHFTERCQLRNKWKQKEHRLHKLYNGH